MTINQEDFIASWHEGEYEKIYHTTSDEFKQLVTLEQFCDLGKDFNKGVEEYKLLHTCLNPDQVTQYVWIDNLERKAVNVYFDSSNQIVGFLLSPYNVYPTYDRTYTKNEYIMPISSEWFVFWGGSNVFINYHYELTSQRYAYDLVQLNNHSTFTNEGLRNSDYYAFDSHIVSPADGTVITIQNNMVDNEPGQVDKENVLGNFIVIEHEHQEYSLIAHLKKESISVKEGDQVKKGQYLGRCGNSGNSTEPHIHFQVMNSYDINKAESIRITFAHDEPIKGDFVR
ncbi:M23 family metallopeptidase [Alkalihalobacillus sp. FSL R5-0424]